MKVNDPAYYQSGYERNDKDRYWTHPWLTGALLQVVGYAIPYTVWEPAAGRGDMTKALMNWGCNVISSDIDLSEFDPSIGPCFDSNFLEMDWVPCFDDGPAKAIITNPPYNVPRRVADKFVRKSLWFMENQHIDFVAMLLRSEFRSGKSRKDMFGDCPHYYGELVLTERPLWDWWFRDEPDNGPRHNFSWFMWKKNHKAQPLQFFHYPEKKK